MDPGQTASFGQPEYGQCCLRSQHALSGRHQPASETPFKCCFAGADSGSLLNVYWIYAD